MSPTAKFTSLVVRSSVYFVIERLEVQSPAITNPTHEYHRLDKVSSGIWLSSARPLKVISSAKDLKKFCLAFNSYAILPIFSAIGASHGLVFESIRTVSHAVRPLVFKHRNSVRRRPGLQQSVRLLSQMEYSMYGGKMTVTITTFLTLCFFHTCNQIV